MRLLGRPSGWLLTVLAVTLPVIHSLTRIWSPRSPCRDVPFMRTRGRWCVGASTVQGWQGDGQIGWRMWWWWWGRAGCWLLAGSCHVISRSVRPPRRPLALAPLDEGMWLPRELCVSGWNRLGSVTTHSFTSLSTMT